MMNQVRLAIGLSWAVAAAAALPAEPAPEKPLISDPSYTHADRLVAINSAQRLNLHCTGWGSPTVVFDAGLGDGTKAWGLVQPEVARFTKACSYDRAGLGASDASLRAGTSANAIDDLHHLLAAAGVRPPYLPGRTNKASHYIELDLPAVVTAAIAGVTAAAGSCARFAPEILPPTQN